MLSKIKSILVKAGAPLFSYLSEAISEIIPGFIAVSMLKVVIIFLDLLISEFSVTTTYTLLNTLVDTMYYFLPVFAAYGGAKILGGNPVYSMIVMIALLHPGFLELVNLSETLTLFGIDVWRYQYANSLFPALLAAYACVKLENAFKRVLHAKIQELMLGVLVITFGYVLTILILAPLGQAVANILVDMMTNIKEHLGFFALAIASALMPYFVFSGVYVAFLPFVIQSIASNGYDDFFRVAMTVHCMSQLGVCIGVYFRSNDDKLKADASTAAVANALSALPQPTLFRLSAKYRRLYGYASIAGGIGGGLASVFKCRVYAVGTSALISLPIYQDTCLEMLLVCAISSVTSGLLTYLLGYESHKTGIL